MNICNIRCTNAEKRLLSVKDIEGDDDDDDDVGGSVYPDMGGRLINRNHRNSANETENDEKKIRRGKLITDDIYAHIGVRPNPTVTRAVNTIDAWMLLTGR